MNARGLLGSPASPQNSRERKRAYLTRLERKNDVLCLQETHGQVLVTQFRVFGTFTPNNLNAGGSVILIRENLLPEGAVFTHVVTYQGRPHCDHQIGRQRYGDRQRTF